MLKDFDKFMSQLKETNQTLDFFCDFLKKQQIMTGCIYHEADLDGVMSAAIVKKYFKGDIDLLPYNYGRKYLA